MPTLALVNAIAFRQMQNPEKEFASVRVMGTVGWIITGFIIGYFNWESGNQLELTFRMAAGASLLLGLFSFTLPHTPPLKPRDEPVTTRDLLGLDAFSLLKDRSFLSFFITSVLICVPLTFYYNFTNLFLNEAGMQKAANKMIMGQISEVLFMLLMPFFFVRLGVKKMLLVGMAAWVLRYVLFAFGDTDSNYWMLILGIVLHGICYDFFFVTGQIYTDNRAGDRFKSAAQGLITFATYGVGMFVGSLISGYIVEMYVTDGGHDWQSIWLIPAGIAVFILALFSLTFRDKAEGAKV
jgi:nucleoside transporter